MAEMIGASEAIASEARGKVRSADTDVTAIPAFVSFIARDLSAPMRAALCNLQYDMFRRAALSSGHTHTVEALRRRGIIEPRGSMISDLGELVIRAAGLNAAEVTHDGPR